MVLLMASKVSATSFPFSHSSSSYSCSRFTASASSSSSSSAILFPRTPQICLSLCNSQLGLGLFSPWSGLKHLGISQRSKFLSLEKRKRIAKGKGVFASLFGVGAPEALVIGVVALLVFGPKGLAEVARTLGKTLRAFQPTIKELQDVSREFKTTLEREIGLDEISSSIDGSYNSVRSNTIQSVPKAEDSLTVAEPTDGSPSASKTYTSEEYLKVAEEQLKASVTQEQVQTNLASENQNTVEQPDTSAPGPENRVTGTAAESATTVTEPKNLGTGIAEESTISVSVSQIPGTET